MLAQPKVGKALHGFRPETAAISHRNFRHSFSMRSSHRLGLILGIALSLAPIAESANTGGLAPIFNGIDLTGWKVPAPNPFWTVVDGVLIGQHDEKQVGNTLWSEKKYGDFVLEFDVRWSGDMDSGIMFREPSSKLQLQIGVSRSLKRDVTGSFWVSQIGYPEAGLAKEADKYLKPEQWNTLRLEARGTTYKAWINGQPVAHYTDANFAAPGSIGLCIHAKMKMKVEYRNIRLKELP